MCLCFHEFSLDVCAFVFPSAGVKPIRMKFYIWLLVTAQIKCDSLLFLACQGHWASRILFCKNALDKWWAH